MSKRLLFTALASLALGGTAFAGDGRLEINQACVATGCFLGNSAGLPVETQPNQSYVLTSSLAIGSAVIGVTLGAGAAGSLIQDCLVLQNGGNAGILINNAQGALGVRVLRNTIHGNQGMGVQGPVSLLTDNVITSNGNLGAALSYAGNTPGFGGNQLWNNNGGNANPQISGGVSVGTNVCGTDTICP